MNKIFFSSTYKSNNTTHRSSMKKGLGRAKVHNGFKAATAELDLFSYFNQKL